MVSIARLTFLLLLLSHTDRLLAAEYCPRFYKHVNFEGGYFEACNSNNVPLEWNDEVSSLWVPSGYNVRLHSDVNDEGILNFFGPGSYNLPDYGWNDILSSYEIFPPHADCPKFYEHVNYQGRWFVACNSNNVPLDWNDRISSIWVPDGYGVTIYQHVDNGGYSRYFGPGGYNLPQLGWNDEISSYEISAP